ncbi:MAG TPA: YebC/PmpR family DNA-binding transcriptional regulator [Gammaproteobacteria bacterium]|nr:YebC/PmpR family DNA-binding transcriptional regulator [Gammaproteobacteria bacterium]
MAGHSKWANIKHRKGAQDAKRGKIFTRLIREITVAARLGGGDATSNPRLRTAIDKALASNMTRDTIDRAIKRGAGSEEADNLEEIRYEGYGPAGVAVMVDCLSDNRNRTVSEVRHAFSKHGGNLGTDGSVSYLFNKLGQIIFAPGADEDKIMEVAIEAGAEDVNIQEDKSIEVTTSAEAFDHVLGMLHEKQLKPAFAEVTMAPVTSIDLDADGSSSLTKLIDALEDLDDVQEVYSNAQFPDN